VIEFRSVVVFPFPNATASVSFTYFSFPLTVFLVSFKRVPIGFGDVVVAFRMAAACRLVTLTSERTPPSGASQPRTIGSTVLLLIVNDRGCEKDGIKRWKGVVVILRGGGGEKARVSKRRPLPNRASPVSPVQETWDGFLP